MQTLVLRPGDRCFSGLNTVFTEHYILRVSGWDAASFHNTSCRSTHLNNIILARGLTPMMTHSTHPEGREWLAALLGRMAIWIITLFILAWTVFLWGVLICYGFYDVCNMGAATEQLTFNTRIIDILTVGAERNVIARVHVEGVERVCQVPPGVFQVGEKVRISVWNVLNVLRVWEIFKKIVRLFNYQTVISVIPIIIGITVF